MPRRLLAVLIFALLLRLAWAFIQPATDAAIDALPDQREYLSLGRNLLHLHRLQFDDPRFHQTIYAYRMPGYPMLVAACGGSVRLVRVAQCFIDVSTVLAVFCIARRAGLGIVPAEIAAGIAAVNPFLIYFSGAILTETCFTAAITWCVFFVIGSTTDSPNKFVALASSLCPSLSDSVGTRSPNPSNRSHLGMILAISACTIIATLLRPTAILVLPLIGLGSPGPIKTRVRRLAFISASIGVVLLAWGIRNWIILQHPVLTTTNDGVTLYDGFNPAATGASDQRFFDRMGVEKSMSEYDRSQLLRRLAREWAIRHPWQVVSLSERKIVRGWSPVPLSQDFGKVGYRVVAGGYAVPFDLAVLGGLCFGRLSRSRKWLLVLPAIGLTVAQVLSVGSLRYRIPAEPAMAVLAAEGMSRAVKNREEND